MINGKNMIIFRFIGKGKLDTVTCIPEIQCTYKNTLVHGVSWIYSTTGMAVFDQTHPFPFSTDSLFEQI
jgi:hypothetical protein